MKYKLSELRELYEVDKLYWANGDTNLLDYTAAIAQRISDKYWIEVSNIVALANKTGKSIYTVIDVLALYGFEMEQELKSCPFCGGEVKILKIGYPYYVYSKCLTCGAEARGVCGGVIRYVKAEKASVAAWNRRKNDD